GSFRASANISQILSGQILSAGSYFWWPYISGRHIGNLDNLRLQSSSSYSRDSDSAPRQLPSGWWNGVPEGFRKSFDRKTLRHGYLLRLDGFVKGVVFFRNAYCATVLDGEARFVCRYRYEPGKDATL